jgi:hypothetical protein
MKYTYQSTASLPKLINPTQLFSYRPQFPPSNLFPPDDAIRQRDAPIICLYTTAESDILEHVSNF